MSDTVEKKSSPWGAMLPMLFGFFVMGFADIIGTVMNQVKPECNLSDTVAGFLPSMIFIWFFLISIPTGVLCGKIGRKKTVLISLLVTIVAMFLPLAASAERVWVYFVAFSLVGIGNTILQAALPALMSNVVPSDQLTSRISLGQFVKAICAALTPVFVYLTATALHNWKLLFPLYGAITILVAIWLLVTDIPRESATGPTTSFGSCFKMLGNPYILAMTVGILFSVGADVGFGVAIPEYLKNVYKVDKDMAGMGPTVYFVAKTIAALAGAAIFAKISAAKCFPWCMGIGIIATAAILKAPTPIAFFVCVFVAALMTANSFGMCMGLAIDKVPEKANEITALMVMAIVGGAIITPVLGWAQGKFQATGIVVVLLGCVLYLLLLGIFANANKKA
ncbi:MAG: MFS transporter [Kiritimatiellae bacterium]|nr:MFS transporter [Kiritimatiellia bacterium]